MLIQVTDSRGWHKETSFDSDKMLIFIGSGRRDDVILDGGRAQDALTVQPRHAQLLLLNKDNATPVYRLVNLADQDDQTIQVQVAGQASEQELKAFKAAEIAPGDVIRIGGFTLSLAEGTQARTGDVSYVVEVKLLMKSIQLLPGGTLEGTIVLRHKGPRKPAQFQLEVEGLPETACRITPASISLFPDAIAESTIQIAHPPDFPLEPGSYPFTLRVSAPGAYPGVVAEVQQRLVVQRFYGHTLNKKRER